MAANKLSSRQGAGELGKGTGKTMTDIPKDNVFDFSKAKAKGKGGGDGTDGGGEKALYYAVQPVVMVEEGDRLIRLRYMTENGYLDILGIMNQIQVHNRTKLRHLTMIAVSAWALSLTALAIVLW